MPRDPGSRRTRTRKRPAYPRPGTGEDFPARRPGTKTGETRGGGKIMQHTRAEQGRMSRRQRPFEAKAIPRATPRNGEPLQVRTPNWTGGRPTGRRQWPFSAGVRGKATRENPWPL